MVVFFMAGVDLPANFRILLIDVAGATPDRFSRAVGLR
jgi:hypothetical protein